GRPMARQPTALPCHLEHQETRAVSLPPPRLKTGHRTALKLAPRKGPCPLWVKSRHFSDVRHMSALPPKADIGRALAHVGFGPIADSCSAANSIAVRSPRRPQLMKRHCDKTWMLPGLFFY